MWAAVIDEGRRLAESLMVDTCEIRSPGSAPVFDEDTGTYTYTPGTLLYSGVCKRQSPAGVRAELEAASGEHTATLSRLQLHIPSSSPAVPAGSLVTMLTCPTEPSSVGRRFRVDGPAGKSFATAQRLNVTEVVG